MQPATNNLAKPKETLEEDNEFQDTKSSNRKLPAKSQSETKILDTEMEANHMNEDTAEDVNLAEVDEISCPSSTQAPPSKKTKKKAKTGPSSVANPTSYFYGKQNGMEQEDGDFQGAYDDKKKKKSILLLPNPILT